jgi:type II secretory ATPase GspE/PulE/Tfp pilus assembly ATPase PilB-like protein
MAKNIDKILGKALVEKNLIDKGNMQAFLQEAEQSTQPLSAIVVQRGVVAEDTVLQILAQKLALHYVPVKELSIDKAVIQKVPFKIASYYKFLPIKLENKVLTIAVSYPLDIKTQDEIRTHLGFQIEMALSCQNDIMEMMKVHYGLAADTIQEIMLKTPQKHAADVSTIVEEKVEDIEKLAGEASVIRLVNQILLEAYQRRATDVHIEPYRGKVKLRYRIDGVLYNAPVPQEIANLYSSIISRIKIIANLNIVERRLPQDGRAVVKIGSQTLDLRISSLPTPYGECLVIRLLPTKMLFSMEKLGLPPSDLAIFENLIKKPHGIIFITGPTGSGKTTTLYACLSRINTDERKIITIEDPIEYELEGITQIQVVPEIGLDFARGLRSMLRHDPDVMMVGEVRDRETSEIAIRVALTGHLVFSTLHTNDAASGITRLVDIGLEPYLVASSVEVFVAQRLVRVLCPRCKAEDTGQPEQIKTHIARELGLSSAKEVTIFKSKGCKECNGTGYFGRTAIYEILLVDDAIRDMILRKTAASEITRIAIKGGMHTLRQDGFRKVIEGMTTPDEVMRVTQEEEHVAGPPVVRSLNKEGPTELPSVPEIATATDDRRVYPRLSTRINISYKAVKPAPRKGERAQRFSVAKNISAGGLAFLSDEAPSIGSILDLRIELPDGGDPIGCFAKVLRVEEAKGGNYNIAVCYLDLSSVDRARMERYIREELK